MLCCVNIVPKQVNAHFVRTHLTPVEKKQLLAAAVAGLTHLLDLFFALKRHLAAHLKCVYFHNVLLKIACFLQCIDAMISIDGFQAD